MSLPPDPVLDRIVDGRYQVEAELAQGGMATVYRARDLRLDRPVALKVMREDLARDDTFVRRFVHEARVAARLQHPHIVSVYDQGEDDGIVFLAMELVEGSTLRDLVSRRAPLSAREALTFFVPVVEALATAHSAGLVHRDVKPENVLISRRGQAVKVTDFGLARVDGNAQHTSEMLWGTAAYLAPEQVEHGLADARTDVYAAGLLLFEMVTGQKAFPGDDALRVAYEHVHGGVPHARELVDTVPGPVEELILRAAATEPADRPADAGALLAELRDLEQRLSDAELDALPATTSNDLTAPVHPGEVDGDRTQVVAGAGHGQTRRIPVAQAQERAGRPGSEGSYARTSGNRAPARTAAPGAAPRRRGGGMAWFFGLLLLLVAAGAGYGYWYFTDGPAVHTEMPVVVGLTEEAARAALDGRELDPVVTPAYSEEIHAGIVMAADVEPGTRVRHGTDVELTVSQGPERYAVPRLEELTLEDAQGVLEDSRLTLGEQTQEHHETIAAGRVISSSPANGELLPPGAPVDVVVSQGRAPVEVPEVTGRSVEDATRELESAGLRVEVDPERVFHDSIPEGSVVTQNPRPSTVDRDSTVRIVVSKGPELVTVPGVVGQQFRVAERELRELGLEVVREDIAGGFFGTVREQSLEPGAQVPKGTEIVIRVV